MMDESETIRVVEPRLTVRFDSDGTWSAWRGSHGSVLANSKLSTLSRKCESAILASNRARAAPIQE